MDGDRRLLTEVVNLREERFDRFIGRPSIYENPYAVGVDGDRDTCIGLYCLHLLMNPALRARAKRELKGLRLGCYCKPLDCHGDVLASVVDGVW